MGGEKLLDKLDLFLTIRLGGFRGEHVLSYPILQSLQVRYSHIFCQLVVNGWDIPSFYILYHHPEFRGLTCKLRSRIFRQSYFSGKLLTLFLSDERIKELLRIRSPANFNNSVLGLDPIVSSVVQRY